MLILIISGIVLLLLIVIMLPIKMHIIYSDRLNIYLELAFYKKELSLNKKEAEHEAEDKLEEQTEKKKPYNQLMYYKELFKELKKDIFDVFEYMRSHGIKVTKLDFLMELGWNDRAQVATAYGLVNAMIYSVMGVLHNTVFISKWNIDIKPYYEKEIFNIKLDCILKTRFVHIMVIGIKLFGIMSKKKKFENTGGETNGTSD